MCRSGEMAYALDSKSSGGDTMRVRLPPPAPFFMIIYPITVCKNGEFVLKFVKLIFLSVAIIFSLTIFASAAQRHIVAKGETIIDIAAMYDTTPLELAVANNLNLNTPLEEGQKIIIVKLNNEEIINNISVPPSIHQVQKGETMTSVAKKYGLSVKTLAKINNLKTSAKLVQGKILNLIIPDELFKDGNIGESMANMAFSLKGIRYISGGTSRGGFDCSGLTSYIYKQFGKTIPRTSAGQFKGGKVIAKNELQKGDIVCFAIRKGVCSHVGIYVGKNKFIHASTHKTGVILSSLNDKYYAGAYIGARRY